MILQKYKKLFIRCEFCVNFYNAKKQLPNHCVKSNNFCNFVAKFIIKT